MNPFSIPDPYMMAMGVVDLSEDDDGSHPTNDDENWITTNGSVALNDDDSSDPDGIQNRQLGIDLLGGASALSDEIAKQIKPKSKQGDSTRSKSQAATFKLSFPILKKHITKMSRVQIETLLLKAAAKHSDVALSMLPITRSAIKGQIEVLAATPGFNDKSEEWVNQKSTPIEAKDVSFLDKFDLFQRFPPEIRVRIWKFAFPGTRIVNIFKSVNGRWAPYTHNPDYKLSTNTKSPVTLWINRESRAETLKHFQPSFSLDRATAAPAIYVNFSSDIICLGSLDYYHAVCRGDTPYLETFAKTGDAIKIQQLACSHTELLHLLSQPLFIYGFKSLKTVFVDIQLASLSLANTPPGLPGAAAMQPNFPNYYHQRHVLYGPAGADTHALKLQKMQASDWVEETKPNDQYKKPLIDEAMTALAKTVAQYPDFNAPVLKFGFIWRKDLNTKINKLMWDKEHLLEKAEKVEKMGMAGDSKAESASAGQQEKKTRVSAFFGVDGSVTITNSGTM